MSPRLEARLEAKENEEIQKAIAESTADIGKQSAASNAQSRVPSASGETSESHAGSNGDEIPESTDDAEADSMHSKRMNPKRRAAARVTGSYKLKEESQSDAEGPPESIRAPPQGPAKRKRGKPLRGKASATESQTGSDEEKSNIKKAALTPPKKRKAGFPGRSNGTTGGIKQSDPAPEFHSLAVQVLDNNEKDEDFNPGSRTSMAKMVKDNPGRYGLRPQRGSSLLVEHVKEQTTKTSRKVVSESGKDAVMKTSKKVVKKQTDKTTSTASTRAKMTMKQRKTTSAKTGLAHVSTPSKQWMKKKPVRLIGPFTNQYKIRFGYTPFPKNHRPTTQSCQNVFDILKKHHERDNISLEQYPDDRQILSSNDVDGPMHAGQEVTFNAIVRTILSQATNNDNAQTVEQTLINRFRYNFLGVKVKGETPNYHAMHKTPESVVAKALASGGLHNTKAKQIKGCLDHVFNMNMKRATAAQRAEAEHMGESVDFIPGMLSLDYMMSMTLQEKFDHLVSMPGIGVKTAACILSFNFEYPIFAVDTHVMRLSRLLRWLPLNVNHENHAFMHLDKRVPDELKYGLHQAFWHHGQICVRCKAGSNRKSKGWSETLCPIEHLVDRRRKDLPKSKQPKPNDDGKADEPKKARRQQIVYPRAKFTDERAAELGYELQKVDIDDGFGVRRSNFKSKPLYKWVLKSDHEATEDAEEAATEEVEDGIEEPEDLDDTMLVDEAGDVLAETDDDAISDSELSALSEPSDEDEDAEIEAASDEEQD